MSEKQKIPINWAWTTIGEITHSKVGQQLPEAGELFTYIEISSIDNEKKTILSTTSFPGSEAPSRARQMLKTGDILISMTRPNLNAVALVPEHYDGAIGSTGLDVLRPILVSPKWLFYLTQSPRFVAEMTALVLGVVYPAIRPKDIRSFEVPLPPPLEQERIVGELDAQLTRLDAAVESLKRVYANLKRYRAAVLKAACEGRLVPTEAALAREEERGYETADTLLAHRPNDGPRIPDGWAWTNLEVLGEIIGGLTKNSLREKLPLKVPYLRVANVYAGALCLDVVYEIGVKESELERALLKKGDLLIVEGNGSEDQIGRVAMWNDEISPCVHQNHLIKARLYKPEIAKYVLLWLLSTCGRKYIRQAASSTSGLYTLSLSKVGSIPIALPPLSEQKRIIAEVERRLSLTDETMSTVEVSLLRAHNLRQMILRWAFEGRLAKQATNDEPAPVLLERIRKAKQQESHKLPTRRRSSRPAPEGRPDVARGVSPESDAPHTTEPRRGDIHVAASEDATPTGLWELSRSRSRHSRAGLQQDAPPGLSFTDLPREEQIDAVWESLFGLGALEKDEAVRTAAEGLRGQGLVKFQRLRQGGPLYQAIEAAIEQGLRVGDFDRPKRGHLRAVLRDPRNYSSETWSFCLLESLDHQAAEESEALRAAAEWAREHMGLEYGRLREDGVILRGLRAALDEAIRRGEIQRIGRNQIRRLSL